MLGLLKVNGRDKGFVIVSFVYMLYVIFPLFADLTHIPVFVPALAVVTYISVAYSSVYYYRPMRWLLCYIILLFIYSTVGAPIHVNGMNAALPFWWRITIESAWIMPAVMIACVLHKRNNRELYKQFGYGSILLLTVSFLHILPLLISSKNILRENLHAEDVLRPIGLPAYDLMHAYTLLLIPLLYIVKYAPRVIKLVAFALAVLFFYVVTQTAVTTSLIVSVVIALFALTYSADNNQKTIISLVVIGGVCIVLYNSGFCLWLVDALMPFFDGTVVTYKLQDLHDSMVSGSVQGGTLTGRMDYHQISKDNFWMNPILGGGVAGGHSKILDILGCTGLVMFIPYVMILWSCLKMQTANLNKRSRAFVMFTYATACIYLYEKGVFGSPGYLSMLVIIPSAIITFESYKNENGNK